MFLSDFGAEGRRGREGRRRHKKVEEDRGMVRQDEEELGSLRVNPI